jgi:hypothetical protein
MKSTTARRPSSTEFERFHMITHARSVRHAEPIVEPSV